MADLRPQFSEEVVAHGHPTKADVTNRAWNIEHEEDGTHKDNVIVTANIKNANVDKDKINTDVAGTGLAGGAGAALSHIAHTGDVTGATALAIGNTKVKKEHINADVVGTGLAGGAGTALSVDGIVEVGASAELKPKVIDIGTWDMDNVAEVNIAHGLTYANIRTAEAFVYKDDGSIFYPIAYAPTGGANTGITVGRLDIDVNTINLKRMANEFFDSADFNDIVAGDDNRGWITIWYVA